MIIVRLQGGLGNQLFQYAFAKAVSKKLKTDFRLDSNPFFTYYKLHKYSLNHFNIKEQIAKDSDFKGFIWIRKQSSAFDTFYKYLRLKKRILPFYYPERMFHYDAEVFSRDGVYFDGFWQTEKYFKDVSDELRREIILKSPLSSYSSSVLEKIKNTNSVSMHIRRADYVSDPTSSVVFGTCSPEYYKKALSHISEKVKDINIFIFSDDLNWAKETFKSLPYPTTFVENDASKNYEDLVLMSNCKHNIIANSSFSWWGAWLNQNKEKIVIAPKRWFNTKKESTKEDDVIPETWLKL